MFTFGLGRKFIYAYKEDMEISYRKHIENEDIKDFEMLRVVQEVITAQSLFNRIVKSHINNRYGKVVIDTTERE